MNTIKDIKKCKTLKKCTINKITTSKFGSVLVDSFFLKKSIDVKN